MNTEQALDDSFVLASSEETPRRKSRKKNIRKTEFLSAEEEAELSRRILDENDLVARNELVKRNFPFVKGIASRFSRWGRSDLEDLIQAGNVGLILAARKYDYRQGRFTTYAKYWVMDEILDELKKNWQEVRVPVHVVNLYPEITRTADAITQKTGRQPTYAEIAEALDLTEKDVRWNFLARQGKTISLEDPAFGPGSSSVSGDGDISAFMQTLADKTILGPELAAEAKEELLWAEVRVKNVLEEVSTKTKQSVRNMKIFKLFYGLDGSEKRSSLRRIGDEVGLTPWGVRTVVDSIWKKLGVGRREEFRCDLSRIQELKELVTG